MKTEKEMRDELKEYCQSKPGCSEECKLHKFFDGYGSCHSRCDYVTLKEYYEMVFGKEDKEMEMFNKEDIKPGYLLEIEADGVKHLAIVTYGSVAFSGQRPNLCYSSEHKWGSIDNLTKDLCHKDNTMCKVTKVYGYALNSDAYKLDTYHRPLLWERREPKEMTVAEIEELLGYPVKIVKE
jgi:hypothetical protein